MQKQDNKKITYNELLQSINNFNTYGPDPKQIRKSMETEIGKRTCEDFIDSLFEHQLKESDNAK